MFPAVGFNRADIDEYNRQARFEYEDVRDFIIAHYKVTRRRDDPFWDHVREMDVPDSLNERFELFRSSGRFFKHGAAELFAEESWVQVLIGQGLRMHADPVTDSCPMTIWSASCDDLANTIEDVVGRTSRPWRVPSQLPVRKHRRSKTAAIPPSQLQDQLRSRRRGLLRPRLQKS